MAPLLFFSLLLVVQTALTQAVTKNVSDCTCGFYDEDADLIFTDATIVYFNKTDVLPSDFVVESFEHKYDRGWNALYRQGAAVDNIEVVNDTSARNLQSLALYCNPADDNGLVVGASMRTARQDIFYGSFRTSMRAPRQWFGGSAISMLLKHNVTESWDIDVMNTDNSSWAWVSMLAEGQFSDLWLGTNFTDLLAAGMNPWYYTEYRVDWTHDRIDYYIGNVLQQSFTKAINGTLPSTPSALHWQHWSLGNEYNTQGPPQHQSEANIGWTRLFFNSSLATKEQIKEFDERCTPDAACRMSDNNLFGSTAYPIEATHKWKQHHKKWSPPWVALTIDIVFAALFTILTMKTLWRRTSWASISEKLGFTTRKPLDSSASTRSSDSYTESEVMDSHPSDSTNNNSINGSSSRDRLSDEPLSPSLLPPPTYSGLQTPAPQYQSAEPSRRASRANSRDDLTIEYFPRLETPRSPYPPFSPSEAQASSSRTHTPSTSLNSPQGWSSVTEDPVKSKAEDDEEAKAQESGLTAATTESKPADVQTTALPIAKPGPKPQQRVDYLAGFISISAILVTLNHFGLTFWAAVIIPSVRPHYQSEIWARKTIASYFLDPLWIGPFLMISTRFLVANYLRTGKLDNMAQKIVARPFRLLTPVASIATLEYFLMDTGALTWLEYLPSVTWSPWPFTSIWPNPGYFISAIIQLAYLIPNAAPMITYNYCTGVLWTIPVQLQGAWQTLLALIILKECKTPWKRFSLYAFCIANHWYGLSWGSYYYAGILLADLDITFKYKKWLHPKPFVYYPLLFLLICVALGGFTIDMMTQWTGIQYAEVEYGWHPDTASGLSISQSGNSVYPDYFIPRLNALLTTVSMQLIVEISPAVQKVLSMKVFQLLFPHIFTVYLIHGFIFWSVGSWAMISIFSYGAPYWLCVTLTFIICYGTLLGSLPILTPPIELLGKKMTLSLWENASQEPAPKRPTTFPFGKELLLGRNVDTVDEQTEEVFVDEKGKSTTDGSDKGKSKVTVMEKSLDF